MRIYSGTVYLWPGKTLPPPRSRWNPPLKIIKPRPKKPGPRRLKIEAAIIAAAGQNWPKTIRHIYYELLAAGIIKKTRSDYTLMTKYAADLRRADMLPWHWIVDGTREDGGITWEFEDPPQVEASVDLHFTGDFWTPSVWQYRDPPMLCQLWTETRGMAAALAGTAARYGVGTTACGGMPSLSLTRRAWEGMQDMPPADFRILYVGDADGYGWKIQEQVEAEFAQTFGTPTTMTRLALSKEEAKEWGDVNAEVVPIQEMRERVRSAIKELIGDDAEAVRLRHVRRHQAEARRIVRIIEDDPELSDLLEAARLRLDEIS